MLKNRFQVDPEAGENPKPDVQINAVFFPKQFLMEITIYEGHGESSSTTLFSYNQLDNWSCLQKSIMPMAGLVYLSTAK